MEINIKKNLKDRIERIIENLTWKKKKIEEVARREEAKERRTWVKRERIKIERK